MKPSDPLSDLLRTWTYEPPADSDFNRSVWARIEQKTSAPRPARGLAAIFAFPLAWNPALAAGFAILLSAAIGSGAAMAYDHSAREKKMAAVYARSIDPLQMTANAAPAHHHQR